MKNNHYFVWCQLVSEQSTSSWGEITLVPMAGSCGHDRRGQVLNEEVSHRDCNIQDMIIED